MEKVRIVYVTDAAYQQLTEFSACSLMLTSVRPLSIIIRTLDGTRGLDTRLEALAIRLGHQVEASQLHVDGNVSSGVALHPHISPVSLFKAHAIEIEAARFERVLYLDGDVLACRPLDVDDVFAFHTTAAAVYDFVSYLPYDRQDLFRHRQKAGRSPDYFNSGVLAIHGPRWVATSITSRYLDALRSHTQHCPFRHDAAGEDPGDCKNSDQCAFNIALEDDWTPLDFRWNVQKPLRHQRLWREAYLRHYTGFRKFLAPSNVNRDDIERSVLCTIKAAAGLDSETTRRSDHGLLFLADRLKYLRASGRYKEKVKFLQAHAARRVETLNGRGRKWN